MINTDNFKYILLANLMFSAKYSVDRIISNNVQHPNLPHQKTFNRSIQIQSIPIYDSKHAADRFIPLRYGQSVEISRFHLLSTVKPKDLKEEPYLNVLSQVNRLNSAWTKRQYIDALDSINLAKGLANNKILTWCTKSSSQSKNKYPINSMNAIDYTVNDNIWDVKPRKKPLMQKFSQIIECDRPFPLGTSANWSSKNVLAIGNALGIGLFKGNNLQRNGSISLNYQFARPPLHSYVFQIIWNPAGNQLLVLHYYQYLVSVNLESKLKVLIKKKCCLDVCVTKCAQWSNDGRYIITGCDHGSLCVYDSNLKKRECNWIPVHADNKPILRILISPDGQFIATIGLDHCVRITLFPEMTSYLEMMYHEVPEAIAWHPWEKGLLCVGGGDGDGSLSLWDVLQGKSKGYKRVDFVGGVRDMTWNKLSGELVVSWFHLDDEDSAQCTIPILSSWHRIVDAIPLPFQCDSDKFGGNVIWNADHTVIGILLHDKLYCWDFFGNSAHNWMKKNCKKSMQSAGQISDFNLRCIR